MFCTRNYCRQKSCLGCSLPPGLLNSLFSNFIFLLSCFVVLCDPYNRRRENDGNDVRLYSSFPIAFSFLMRVLSMVTRHPVRSTASEIKVHHHVTICFTLANRFDKNQRQRRINAHDIRNINNG